MPLNLCRVLSHTFAVVVVSNRVADFCVIRVVLDVKLFNRVMFLSRWLWHTSPAFPVSAGNWSSARRCLRAVIDMAPDDGPTQCLLEYMQEYDAPHDWPGYRELTEK